MIIDYGLSQKIGVPKRDHYGTYLPDECILSNVSIVNYTFDVYSLGFVSFELFYPTQFEIKPIKLTDIYKYIEKSQMSPLFLNFIKKCIGRYLDIDVLEIHPFLNENYDNFENYFKILKQTPLKRIKYRNGINDENDIIRINNSTKITSELFPNNSKMIEFGDDFNGIINRDYIANKKVVIFNNPNYNIINLNFCFSNVEYICIKGIGVLEIRKITHNSLETFIYEGEFENDYILEHYLFPKTKHLILKNYKNIIRRRGIIPEGVTFLELSDSIGIEVIKSFINLPNSIEELSFGCTEETLKQIERNFILQSINFFIINGKLMKFSENNKLEYYK
ncbi:hypothetical protein ACTFIR_005355 [Dictyostelium discoideum]